ncbi:MAG: hypothetical protein OJF50_000155 [Nitrospira sp.]|jgi:Cu(I)/Ag(I) efflux system membrane fusion protein|nr:hypothetical protein [Nitrospira sp.]
MKSITQFVAVSLVPAVVSGCMCMMPMEKMDMGKDNMGQMDMGDKGRSHEMTGTKSETTKAEKRVGDLIVAFSTIPAKPTVGENVLRVKLTYAGGGTVSDAVVTFDVTMTMPGMTVMEEKAAVTKDVYQANRNFGMAGEWQITVKIQRAGEAELHETFTVTVA